MSTDYYFYNKTKNEHVHAYANHNRKDTLRWEWPKLFTWLMMHAWVMNEVVCIPDSDDMGPILESKNMTNHYIKLWNNGEFNEWVVEEHGSFKLNRHVEERENRR